MSTLWKRSCLMFFCIHFCAVSSKFLGSNTHFLHLTGEELSYKTFVKKYFRKNMNVYISACNNDWKVLRHVNTLVLSHVTYNRLIPFHWSMYLEKRFHKSRVMSLWALVFSWSSYHDRCHCSWNTLGFPGHHELDCVVLLNKGVCCFTW